MSKTLSSLEKEIIKQHGEICFTADQLKFTSGKVIPLTLSLDLALHGGIQEGHVVSITGVSGSGKSTLALTLCANAQKMGKTCYWLDAEGRLQDELISTIPGLDKSKLIVIKSTKGNFLTAEKYLDILQKIVSEQEGVVIVVDSVAALCTANAQATSMEENPKMAGLSQFLYRTTRQLAQILASQKSNVIFISHVQDNPGGYVPREMGGNAIKFQSSYRIMCLSSQELKSGKEEKAGYGRVSMFKVMKSALGPGTGDAPFFIKYGQGYYYYHDLFQNALDLGLVAKAGAWYSMTIDKEEVKLQGEAKMIAWLEENPKLAEKLDKQIRESVLGKK